jgi:hypothetical protein
MKSGSGHRGAARSFLHPIAPAGARGRTWTALLVLTCAAACDNTPDAEEHGITIHSAVVRLEGTTLEDSTIIPLPDVEVCVFDLDGDKGPCTRSRQDGNFSLHGVPPNSQVTLSFEGQGLMPSLQLFDTDEAEMQLTEDMATVLVEADFDDQVDEEFRQDPDLGAVGFFGLTPTNATASWRPLDQYRVHLDPPAAQPIFASEASEPDPELNESSSLGIGVIQNLAPGLYRMTFERSGMRCQGGLPGAGWRVGNGRGVCPGADADARSDCGVIEVRAVAGWVTTQVGTLCQ